MLGRADMKRVPFPSLLITASIAACSTSTSDFTDAGGGLDVFHTPLADASSNADASGEDTAVRDAEPVVDASAPDASAPDALAPDAGPTSICGNPGDHGNALGVGSFCNTVDDCANNTRANVCATVGNGEAHFCTITCDPCTSPPDFCGTNAGCLCGPLGCGCTPTSCIMRLADGGIASACSDGGPPGSG
jgi:hypothetical protein